MTYARMIRFRLDNLLVICYATSVFLFSYAEGKTFLTKIAAITLAALFVFRAFRNPGFVVFTREFVLVAVWLGYATVSALFAQDQAGALDKMVTLLQVIPASYVVFCVMAWTGTAYPAWTAMLAATVVMSIPTYLHPEAYSVGGRLTASLGNANLYGLALVIGIVISVHFISVYKSIIARLILIWLIPFLFYMLLQTGSRKAMVGLVLLLPFVGFGKAKATFTRNKLAGFGMLAVSLVLVASSVYYIMNSTYYFRLEDAMQAAESRDLSKADRSLRGRIALYEIGLKLAWDNPFLGVGLNNFRLTRTGGLFGHETGAYSHSNYIEVLVSTGFIGFALYFSVYGSLMLRLLKLRKAGLQGERLELYIVTTGLFLMYSVDDFAMVSFYEKASWLILATIMANIYLLERNAMTVLPKAAKKPAGGAAPTQNRPLFSGESTACRSLKARLGRSGEPH